jgi:hypothetical protein
MVRHALVLTAFLGFAGAAPAATWADGMFDSLSHDFGTVPRGPIVTHYFQVTNNTGQLVHIASVRVSCGCLSASATRTSLQPGERTTIVAKLDTNRFSGLWRKPMYVTFDQPQWAEVTIMVQAVSRDDVNLSPETLSFGKIRHGASPEASVAVAMFGGNWRVVDARSETAYVQPRVSLARQAPGETTYQVTARLRPDLPPGNWYTSVKVFTDNPAMPQLTIPLSVDVGAPLTVSPGVTAFGKIKKGADSERKILVRADQPFKIVDIKGADKQVRVVDENPGSAAMHRLLVTVRPAATGPLTRTIQIITDLKDDNRVNFQTTGDVEP